MDASVCQHAIDGFGLIEICWVVFFLQIYSSLTSTEVLTLFLAAFCHDVDHPG